MLAEKLIPEDRKCLLRMLDAQNHLKNEVSLESFAAGFKLAAGIAKKLEAAEYDCNSCGLTIIRLRKSGLNDIMSAQ